MRRVFAWFSLWGALVFFIPACRSSGPHVGSQTNWLRSCDSPSACGELVCVCGTCTLGCDDATDCGEFGSGSCVAADDAGVTAACDGQTSTTGMCLPRCDEETCPEGTSCVAGVCLATRAASATVVVDPATRYQTLIGFGASLGYDEDFIVGHPLKERIYDAMFADSGFDFVRVLNRFNGDNVEDLDAAREILDAAEDRLGRRPSIFLASGSPPPSLKANGYSFCRDGNADCTLIRDDGGAFDYAGFAEYWRGSLEAYSMVGIVPDFVSIQNNPDWIPPDEAPVEACRFLPEEGVADVETPDGIVMDAEFPGYGEALSAVAAAVETLPEQYYFSGPETSEAVEFEAYSDVLSEVSSLSFHFYETDPLDPPIQALENIRRLGEERDQPIIQSEMSAAGIDTALLVHHALTSGGGSGYLQLGFVVPTDDKEFGALIGADDTSFELHPAYFALWHFARFTSPGWARVEVEIDSDQVLSSAWMSPEEDALTLVLVNGREEPADVEIVLPEDWVDALDSVLVTRTVFDGVERMADLGGLPDDGVVRLPPSSVVTVRASSD